MQINLVSTSNGYYDFDISEAGTVRRVTVSENIKHGEMFNIYYGDGHYIPHRKAGATWLGKKGIGGYLVGDLEKSIRKAEVFIAETIDSDEFYNVAAKKHCKCTCSDPYVKDQSMRTLLAVDLDHPEYGRSTSRNIIYLSKCGRCSKPLTHGTGFGSFYSNGLSNLKQLAEKEARCEIEWNSIISSINEL